MQKLRMAFLGLRESFDYFQIGGVESFIRRIILQIVRLGNEVEYILYGSDENKVLKPLPGLTLRYFKKLKDAFDLIPGNYDSIISLYFLPKDKLKFAFFRRRYNNLIKFHFIYFNWPDLVLKRKIYLLEPKIFPYNGKLFCISKRQYNYVKKWTDNTAYLLPPVPENYFLKPEEKPKNKKIKITFLGRIDTGKGIEEVINIFRMLKNNGRFECRIYGIHIQEDKESLKIHNWLKNQKEIKYFEIDRMNYSPQVENMVRQILKETDIFIQPYQKLSSSIDTPLLLSEAMASLCCVITKPFGNIPDIYGESEFLVPAKVPLVEYVFELVKKVKYKDIINERERIFKRNKELNFNTESITNVFLNNLKENK